MQIFVQEIRKTFMIHNKMLRRLCSSQLIYCLHAGTTLIIFNYAKTVINSDNMGSLGVNLNAAHRPEHDLAQLTMEIKMQKRSPEGEQKVLARERHNLTCFAPLYFLLLLCSSWAYRRGRSKGRY